MNPRCLINGKASAQLGCTCDNCREVRRRDKKRHMEKYPGKWEKSSMQSWKRKYYKLKRQVFEHYGGNPPKCCCCGESNYGLLTLNHFNGGGTKHRQQMDVIRIFKSIIRDNFPPEYDIRCYNCNCVLTRTKICPHQYKISGELVKEKST